MEVQMANYSPAWRAHAAAAPALCARGASDGAGAGAARRPDCQGSSRSRSKSGGCTKTYGRAQTAAATKKIF